MKRRHFEALRPICPVCRTGTGTDVQLRIANVFTEEGENILQGVLHCSNSDCQREYPIIDGMPVIVADLRSYLAGQMNAVCYRCDLAESIESILGDCCGPGSVLDTMRQRLSSYAWDHYADLDPQEPSGEAPPASLLCLQNRAFELADQIPAGPIIDIGCSVGRTTFELAQCSDDLVLGVDLDFSMLRLAADVLLTGAVRYPRRRVGLVYDRREFPVDFPGADRVDFWICDATSLPLAEGTFTLASSLNVLDSVASPHDLLTNIARVLKSGGKAFIGCPYDWSAAASPVETWLGGHSQRGPHHGASEPVLRGLLTPGGHPNSIPGLQIRQEADGLIWRVRMHDRSTVEYRVHLVVAEATVG